MSSHNSPQCMETSSPVSESSPSQSAHLTITAGSPNNCKPSSASRHYLHPDYLDPLIPSAVCKQSPLALLAETCKNIGKEHSNDKVSPRLTSSSHRSTSSCQSSPVSLCSDAAGPSYFKPDPITNQTQSKQNTNSQADSKSNEAFQQLKHTAVSKNSTVSPHIVLNNNHIRKSPTSQLKLSTSNNSTARKVNFPKKQSHSPSLKSLASQTQIQKVSPSKSLNDKIDKLQSSSISSAAVESAAAAALNLAASRAYFASGGGVPLPGSYPTPFGPPPANLPPNNNPWISSTLPNSIPVRSTNLAAASMLRPNAATINGSTISPNVDPATATYLATCHAAQGPCFCLTCIQQKLMTDSYSLYNNSPNLLAAYPQLAVTNPAVPGAGISSPTKPAASVATAEYCMYCGKHCQSEDDLLSHMQQHIKSDTVQTVSQSLQPPFPSALNATPPSTFLSPTSIPSSASFAAAASLAAFNLGLYPGLDLTRKINGSAVDSSHRFHPFRPPLPSRLAANIGLSYGAGIV